MSILARDRYALPDELAFHDSPAGLAFAQIRNAQARARIYLQGAQLTAWQPDSQAHPVIWTSASAAQLPGKSIRGGVPVCWPWFGPHGADPALPAHGFARGLAWNVCDSGRTARGETRLTLALEQDAHTRSLWPHDFRLELHLTIGQVLRIELVTINTGEREFLVGEALHTYFAVGDIGSVRVLGLEQTRYVDKTRADAKLLQSGAIGFGEEVDRVYLDSESECVIDDELLGRRIFIAKRGSRSTVVWNPWEQKALKMGDLGAGAHGQGGWREMVCVESGNALENAVRVAPGEKHRLEVSYRVQERG